MRLVQGDGTCECGGHTSKLLSASSGTVYDVPSALMPQVGAEAAAQVPVPKEDVQERPIFRDDETGSTLSALSIQLSAAGRSLSVKNVAWAVVSADVETITLRTRMGAHADVTARRPRSSTSPYSCDEKKYPESLTPPLFCMTASWGHVDVPRL